MSKKEAIAIIEAARVELMNLAQTLGQTTYYELQECVKEEMRQVRGSADGPKHPKVWANAMVIKGVLWGAWCNPFARDLAGYRIAYVKAAIIGARYSEKIRELGIDRDSIEAAQELMWE